MFFMLSFMCQNNFALPVEAILGLNSLKELHMIINAERNAVIYRGKHLVGMDNPSPLASQDLSDEDSHHTVMETHSVSPVDIREQIVVEDKIIWPTVAAKVEGTQEIPDRAMKSIKIEVQEAHVGSDICIEGVLNINRVGVESTLSRVREGLLSEALVVNTSGAPITLKNSLHLDQCRV